MKKFRKFSEAIKPNRSPEQGREEAGNRFVSSAPKAVSKPAPQVASEEVEQIDENSDETSRHEAYNHYKKQVLPIYKKHGLSPEFAKAVNNHVAKHGSYQVWNHHGDADGQNPHWFDSEKQKVKPIKQKRGYEVSEEVVVEGAPELLKKQMPLHRHAEKLLAQNGVSKDDPDYHHHLGNTIKHLRQFGNIDLINKQDVAEAIVGKPKYSEPNQSGRGLHSAADYMVRTNHQLDSHEYTAVTEVDGDGDRYYFIYQKGKKEPVFYATDMGQFVVRTDNLGKKVSNAIITAHKKATDRGLEKYMNEEVEQIEEGRPSQRHPLEGHEYHKKTDAELVYIAKDAHKAAEAMKSHNTTAENKYRDQANDSATVRYFRQKNGMPDWYKKKYGHMKEDIERIEEVRKMASGGRDNAGGQYYDIDNDDGTIGFGYKPGKSQPSSSHSNYEYKPEPKHPLHGKIVTAKHSNGEEVTGKMMGTEHQGTVAKIKHSSGMIHHTDAKTVKKANSGMKEDIERVEEMDKSQTPPGRDGGYQFAPGPKVSKKDIEAVKKNPAKHLSDLFAKEYAKKKMKEEVVDEAKDPKEYGYEGDMAMNQLQTIMRHAEYLMDMMKPDTDLPEWVQSKITLATDYLQTSCDYMTSEMKEEVKTPPFAGPYKKAKDEVKDKSGAKHSKLSRVKHLAKLGMKKVNEEGMGDPGLIDTNAKLTLAKKKTNIVKGAAKNAKDKDSNKFNSDPVLSSPVAKQNDSV